LIGFNPEIQLLESEDSTMPIKKLADAYHDELNEVFSAERKYTGIFLEPSTRFRSDVCDYAAAFQL